jgi:hypothetical protein
MLTGGPIPTVGGHGVADVRSAFELEQPAFRRIGSDVRMIAAVLRKQSAQA